MQTSRRQFMIVAASLASSAALLSKESQAAEMLSESDPTAQTLGYKENATKVDKAKFPKYQAGEACDNCSLYQGKAGAANGPCPIYAGKLVAAKGWCNAYVKKA
ncbi:hypothetical protein PATSB16_16280 [Pandoraea thiooxydans]|uniref:High-potential iron-sulfur protein n=1 Tax=Pandoraea thiooxydans TaxID=445709 RepID=A0A0G3ELF4_9BURK|nr:high-potential iron-sulfur protein [Pandoraea thiooxydans]AKJ67800.1 High potential iron-sulfur protein [Pandoraea thiooxydans]APR94970.1 hypothetical protein PATSB16_16280 [Pandoraea thiooxydans]